MADDKKKSKIDLKARLGKTAVPAGGAAVPVPVPGASGPGGSTPPATSSSPGAGTSQPAARPSVPVGIAPPPGLSPGIPLPPFAQRAAPQREAKPTAAQQTIKVEVGEEVEQERKKATKKMALYAAIAAVVGIGVGFVGGGAQERGKRGTLAIEGAGALEKDVKAANEKMKELNDKVTEAAKQLGEKKFPQEFTKELGAINVPFDAFNLEGKQVGSLPGKVLRQVLSYTTAVQDLNKTKDSLKNQLAASQAGLEKVWKEEKEPVVNFAVLFRKDGDKYIAEFVPTKDTFPFGAKEWPGKFKVNRPERTPQGVKPVEKEVSRYAKGDLTGGSDMMAVPVDPQTVSAFTSEQVLNQLARQMRDLRALLEGNKDNPTAETPGLLKEGDDLANELHKISLHR